MPHGIVPPRASASRAATAGGSAQNTAIREIGRNRRWRWPRKRVRRHASGDGPNNGTVGCYRDEDERSIISVAPSGLAELRGVRGLADRHITAARCRHARRTIRRSVLAVRLLLGTATRLANLAVHPARVRSPRRAQTDQHHQRQHRGDENGPTSSGVHSYTIHIGRARAFQNRLHALWQSERPDTSEVAQRLRVGGR